MNSESLAERLLALFITELEEQLRLLNGELLALESDPRNPEGIGALFRIVHTLKGAASAAHEQAIARICHLLEAIFARARDGETTLGEREFVLLFRASDYLADAAECLKAGRAVDEEKATELEVALQRDPPPSAPSPAAIVPPRPAPAPAPPAPARAASPRRELVRIEAHKLDALVAAVGQLRAARARISAQAAGIEELHALASQHLAGWGHTVRRLRAPAAAAALPGLLASDFIRAHDDLARLADAAGRLSLSAREGQRALALATDEVIHGIRGARMRRFSDACVPLPRAVRDLAAASGREVQLEIFGADVEADRDVVDVLSDVLLHLVRNAVDHGLEPPDERARAGKPRTGTVTVTASHAGSGLRITVADNGRGLRLQSIRDRLVERGEPVPDDARALARVLFQPGFSTRSEANDISGRGVGLDVVRTSLEQIGGSVDLHWSEGQGATFTLQCPATLSTLRALLVGVDSQRFAIPTLHVERLSRIRPDQVVRVQGKPSIPTRNGPIPLVSLATVLGPPLRANPATEVMQVVRLAIGGRRVALAVDELIAEEEIIVRPLDRIRRPPASIAGAALLPDGQVALVLHASVILATALGHEGSDIGLADPARPLPAPKRILVVDDSITTRTLEASILQTAGFEVATAVDGEDAWRLLQAQPFDLVVSDVEMPRMDGFALCRAIRGAPRLAKTPLVLVSALETAEHRRLGLEAGADAYLPKSSFDQRDLLDTIQQLLD